MSKTLRPAERALLLVIRDLSDADLRWLFAAMCDWIAARDAARWDGVIP